MFETLLTSDLFVDIITSLLGLGLLYLIRLLTKRIKDQDLQEEVFYAIEQGVSKAQEDFVIWAKRANDDGKLTRDERLQAVEIAKTHAMNMAKNPKVKNIIREMYQSQVDNLVKRILARRK